MSQDDFLVENVSLDLHHNPNHHPNPKNESVIVKKVFDRCKSKLCLKPVGEEIIPTNNIKNNITSSLFNPTPVQGNTITLENIPVNENGIQAIDGTIQSQEAIKLQQENVSSVELTTPITTTIKFIKLVPPGPYCKSKLYDITLQYNFTYNVKLLDNNCDPIKVNLVLTPTTSSSSAANCKITEIPCKVTFTKTISLEGGHFDPNTLITTLDTADDNCVNRESRKIKTPDVYAQAFATPLDVRIGIHKFNTITGTPSNTVITVSDKYYIDVTIGLCSLVSIYRLSVLNIHSLSKTKIDDCESPEVIDNCCGFEESDFPLSVFDQETHE